MRHVLGRYLPPKGKILAERPGMGLVTLQNSDPVPERVTVSEFHGSRNFYTCFTPRQSFVALSMMKTMFERAAMQRKLDQFETDYGPGGPEYRMMLGKLLGEEVYPKIFRRLRIPVDDLRGSKVFQDAMSSVGDSRSIDLIDLWRQVETLMRNMAVAEMAAHTLAVLRGDHERIHP